MVTQKAMAEAEPRAFITKEEERLLEEDRGTFNKHKKKKKISGHSFSPLDLFRGPADVTSWCCHL